MTKPAQSSAYLSMTELAKRLDLPESTMRYYCKRFAKFLPYKGEGRRRRYAPETEKILVFIASAMHQNKNATAVELMLQSGRFLHTGAAVVPEVAPANGAYASVASQTTGVNAAANNAEQGTNVALANAPHPSAFSAEEGKNLLQIMERQAVALSQISSTLSAFVEQLARYGEAVASQGAAPQLVPTGEGAQEWRKEVDQLRQQMNTAEQVHQEDLEQLRKWLANLGEAVARNNR
ncbi:MerR family transcriptional regulator [Desulfovibrio sp. OttesenSCG-928-F07]|nr:MerR family transcriptional regulator [Desulfovibrio sp. OttesenSCG-928-F07]